MRKGFIPTLTALVSAFLVTSALALGPTISNVPDVFIGNQEAVGAPTEPGVNTFRYSDALVLWDYVTPGVDTGDGSTSDTLYWAWAAKKADLAGGTGTFLDPSIAAGDPDGIVYSIIQENALVIDPIEPVQAEGSSAWTAEINGYLTGLGAGLADQSLAAAGSLTFRNIRLSPLPEQASYPAPTANPNDTPPAGYYDVQEATLYVSDTATTPGFDRALILTVEGDAPDTLSGGPVWTIEDDWRDATSGFTAFLQRGSQVNVGLTPVIDPPGVSFTNTGTSLIATVPTTNPTDTYHLVLMGQDALGGSPLDANLLYRMRALLSTTNASATSNPGVLVGLNGRANGPGWGFSQIVDGYADGPQAGRDYQLDGYLWPAASAVVPAQPWVLDQGAGGGPITFDNLTVESVDPTTLVNPVSVWSETTFNRNDSNVAGAWAYFSSQYPGRTDATWSPAPANGATGAAELVLSATTGGSATREAFAQFGTPGPFTPTAGKLVVCDFQVSSNVPVGAVTIPDMWFAVPSGAFIANFIMNRVASPANGPTSTPSSYYVVFEVPATAGTFDVNFRAMAEDPTDNGDLRLQSVTVTEYDMPAAP